MEVLFSKQPMVSVVPKIQETANQLIGTDTILKLRESGEVSGIKMTFIDVNSHLRNLYQGWKASPEKIVLAVEYGYNLAYDQTWGRDYIKRGGLVV